MSQTRRQEGEAEARVGGKKGKWEEPWCSPRGPGALTKKMLSNEEAGGV